MPTTEDLQAYRTAVLLDELVLGKIRCRHDPAVHHQRVAVNKCGIIAHEKERRFRLILRSSQTPRKIFKRPASRNIIVESDGRTRSIGNHTINPNIIRRELHSQGSRHVDDASLGRSISDAIGPSDHPGGGAEVNDLSSASLLRHLCRNILGYQVQTLEAYRDDPIKFLLRAVEYIRVIRDGSVIDENIDAAKARSDFFHHILHIARLRNITQHEHRFLT